MWFVRRVGVSFVLRLDQKRVGVGTVIPSLAMSMDIAKRVQRVTPSLLEHTIWAKVVSNRFGLKGNS